jgi:hypothetical protein
MTADGFRRQVVRQEGKGRKRKRRRFRSSLSGSPDSVFLFAIIPVLALLVAGVRLVLWFRATRC